MFNRQALDDVELGIRAVTALAERKGVLIPRELAERMWLRMDKAEKAMTLDLYYATKAEMN